MKNQFTFKSTLLVFSILFLSLFNGCNTYKVKYIDKKDTSRTKPIIDRSNPPIIVIHSGNEEKVLKNIQWISQDSLTADLVPFDGRAEELYNVILIAGKAKYTKGDKELTKQLHVFVEDMDLDQDGILLKRSDVISLTQTKPESAKGFWVTTATVGAIAAAGTIFLLIACNCPHAYIADRNNNYYYNNTLFTGATSANIERHDYKAIPDYFPNNEKIDLIIKNEEAEEKQYTNLLELMVVEHDKSTRVSSDQRGVIHTLSNEKTAQLAKDDAGNDLKLSLDKEDDLSYKFNVEAEEIYSHIYATFEAPTDIQNAKLIVRAKNTSWAKLVYNEFSELFGNKYQDWQEGMAKKDASNINKKRKEAGIPLVVSIKSNGQWVDVESIDLIGGVNYSDIVVPIDPDYLFENEKIELRIRSGFMFWDVDYLAMDFSPQGDITVNYVSPSSAIDNYNQDVTQAISADDELYMESLTMGDSSIISYDQLSVASESRKRSIFIHSKGYYLDQTNYSGKPDRKALLKFRQKGVLSALSREMYNTSFIGKWVSN